MAASTFLSSARHLLCVYLNRDRSTVRAINVRQSRTHILHNSDRLYIQSGTFFVPRTTPGIRMSEENSSDARRIFIVGDFAPRWRRFISASLRSSNLTARATRTTLVFVGVKITQGQTCRILSAKSRDPTTPRRKNEERASHFSYWWVKGDIKRNRS